MAGTGFSTMAQSQFEKCECAELVRGAHEQLLERLMPRVRSASLSLDLSSVERIDAAGLTALIRLYCAAREAGADFSVMHPSAHVAEILRLVGLDKVLVSRDPQPLSYAAVALQQSAA